MSLSPTFKQDVEAGRVMIECSIKRNGMDSFDPNAFVSHLCARY